MRFLLMVFAVSVFGSISSADQLWKIAPSMCEQKILADAVQVKTDAKEVLRNIEDAMDNQIDAGNITGISFQEQQAFVDARYLLDEVRRLQNGGKSTGALERFCKKGLFQKPNYY